jgi:hypothetical protein
MIDESQARSAHDGVFRLGGLAGIFGALLMFAAFLPVGLFAGGFAADPAEALMRFPDVRAAQAVEEVLYLGVIALWAVHFLALYRALRATSPAAALFGSGLGIMGLILLAAGALPQVATAPISDLYHAPGATPEDQATLVLLWQTTWGMLDALLVAGLLLLPIALLTLGVAMLRTPAFGTGYGWVSVALGALGAGGASLMIVDPASVLGPMAGMFTLIIFHFVVGWKVYRLSRDSAGTPEDRGYTENGVRADGDSNPSKYLDAVQQGR